MNFPVETVNTLFQHSGNVAQLQFLGCVQGSSIVPRHYGFAGCLSQLAYLFKIKNFNSTYVRMMTFCDKLPANYDYAALSLEPTFGDATVR